MSIFVVGINHKTAPVTLREKMYFAFDKLALYLQDLLSRHIVKEAVLLSTCNRSEIYCYADDLNAVLDWFFAQTTVPREQLQPLIYVYQDEAAVAHMMEVACGLDSMVLGEPQILGQMKEAFAESCTASAVGTLFYRLFQHIFTVAKEIRTTTSIGACPVSVASAAAHFAKQQTPDFANAKILLIGAGDTIKLLLRYLPEHLNNPLMIVNRSVENAALLTEDVNSEVYGFDQLEAALIQADIVFSATGSAVPIVNKDSLASVMQARLYKPMMLIDIAVPRDIDPAVTEITEVNLFCIDDLKAIIEKNRQGREHAADKARELIRQQSCDFINEFKLHDKVTHTIRAYRGQVEDICRIELVKAKQQLLQGANPSQVLEAFAQAFTKKLLHTPSVQLRQAGVEGRFELLRFAKQLFAIPDPEVERL